VLIARCGIYFKDLIFDATLSLIHSTIWLLTVE
jgi:hypothetical protein